MAALVSASGRDDVPAQSVGHDGPIVVPAVGTTAAGCGAVCFVWCGCHWGASVAATGGEDVIEGNVALIWRGARRYVAVLVDVRVHGGPVLEGTVLFRDDLGSGEILATETVDCDGTLSVAEGWGVIIRAVVAPPFVVVRCCNLLGKDDSGGQREEYSQEDMSMI